MARPLPLLLAAAATAIYAGTLSRWHSYDFLMYAADAESGTLARMLRSAHLGYDFLGAAGAALARWAGLPVRALEVLLVLNLCAAGLSLWRLGEMLLDAAGPRAAAWAVLGLGASFSFWNYAVEGEVYAPANAAAVFLAASLWDVLRGAPVREGRLAALWILAVLLHQYNVLLAPLVVYVLARTRGWPVAVRACLLAGLPVLAVYAWAAHACGQGLLAWTIGYGNNPETWGTSLKWALPYAGFTLARAFFGWIDGHLAKEILLGRVFHGRLLGEDLDRMWHPTGLLSARGLAFLLLMALTAAALLWLARVLRKSPHRGACLAWILPFLAFFTFYDAGNVEFSPSVLIPLWAAAGLAVGAPGRAAWALVLLLAAHNAAFAILPRRLEPNGEKAWAVWLEARRRPGDSLLVLDATESAYGKYFTGCGILNARELWRLEDDAIAHTLEEALGRGTLYVEGRILGDREIPDPWWEGRAKRFQDPLRTLGNCKRIRTDGWRTLYVLEPHARR